MSSQIGGAIPYNGSKHLRIESVLIGLSYRYWRRRAEDGSQRVVQSRRLELRHFECRAGLSDDAGTWILLFRTCSKKVCAFVNFGLRYGILCYFRSVVFLGI